MCLVDKLSFISSIMSCFVSNLFILIILIAILIRKNVSPPQGCIAFLILSLSFHCFIILVTCYLKIKINQFQKIKMKKLTLMSSKFHKSNHFKPHVSLRLTSIFFIINFKHLIQRQVVHFQKLFIIKMKKMIVWV